MPPDKVNLEAGFATFTEAWSPRLAAAFDGMEVKLTRLRGDFVWHHHDAADELFLVVSGRLCMRFRDGDVWLEPGELIVVPAGVEHCPSAPEEVHVVLIERAGTVNTGSAGGERTAAPVPL